MKPVVTLLFLSFIFGSNAFAQFRAGYYYTKAGVKKEGLLRMNIGRGIFDDKSDGGRSLSYKASKNADKELFTTNDICCFVIEGDSFAIIQNVKPKGLLTPTYPQDFVRVVETGKINLYRYSSIVSNGQYSYTQHEWFVEKDGKQEKLTQLHFEEQLAEYIGDYPALFERVKRNQLTYSNAKDDTQAIIKFYNDRAKMSPK